VLVAGGGDSAIESALGLSNQRGTEVVLSYRGESFGRVRERNRAKIDTAIANGRVRALFRSTIREIRADVVVMEIDGEAMIMPNDFVFVRIGGDAPYAFLERLGVRIVPKDLPVSQEPARAG
jgi:thioredoxin reductase (NADPH)